MRERSEGAQTYLLFYFLRFEVNNRIYAYCLTAICVLRAVPHQILRTKGVTIFTVTPIKHDAVNTSVYTFFYLLIFMHNNILFHP